MQCCKCTGKLHESKSTNGNTYNWCNLCKGLWISKDSLQKVFNSHKIIKSIMDKGLQTISKVNYRCPTCDLSLINGQLSETSIVVEQCIPCNHYFFDEKELNHLFDFLKHSDLPKAKDLDWTRTTLVESKCKCPLCEKSSLFGLNNQLNNIQICIECDGVATNTHCLQKIAKKSLFGPAMFEFRKGGEIIKFCHFCSQAQDKKNEDCIECGRPLKPLKCHNCNSQFSEYELNDVIIDRCHFCNSIWLDKREFEKIMTIMPDVKKLSENRYLRDQLRNLKLESTSEVYSVAIDQHRRELLNNILGPLIGALFFY